MSLKRIHVPVCVLALAVSKAQGAGLELNQHGVKELGHGFAGTAALLEDASAIAHNPAGLTRLESSQFSGGLTALYADIEYDATLFTGKIEEANGGLERRERDPGAPGRGESQAITPIPHLYYSHKVNEDTAIGLGIYAPFGSGSDFPNAWQGRYHAEETSQTTVNINPTMATRLSDTVSVGLGAVIQMYEATLTNQIDVGYLVAEAVSEELASEGDLSQDQLDDLYDEFIPADDPTRFDLHNDIEIDSIAYGFSFGMLWEPTETTRLGFNFRSRTEHLATGQAERPLTEEYKDSLRDLARDFLPDEEDAAAVEAAFDKRGAEGGDLSSNVTFPEILELSFHQQFRDRWAVMGSIAYTNWSVFDEIRLEYDITSDGETADSGDTSAPDRGGEETGSVVRDEDGNVISDDRIGEDLKRRDLVQPLNFEDSMRYALGLSYDWNDRLTLRTGASYDESPLQDSDFRTPRGPDNDRIILGLGASYTVDDHLSIDAAYAFTRIKEADVSPRENPAHTLHSFEGTTQTNLHSLGVQANYNF